MKKGSLFVQQLKLLWSADHKKETVYNHRQFRIVTWGAEKLSYPYIFFKGKKKNHTFSFSLKTLYYG